jgi:hypothetical protein
LLPLRDTTICCTARPVAMYRDGSSRCSTLLEKLACDLNDGRVMQTLGHQAGEYSATTCACANVNGDHSARMAISTTAFLLSPTLRAMRP